MNEKEFKIWVSWGYTSCEGGGLKPGQEGESYPERAPQHKEHEVFGVFTEYSEKRGWDRYNEEHIVNFEPQGEVYVVVVTYQTGDTFGYSTGNVSIVGVFNSEDKATEVATAIRNETYKGYSPWSGYFESLEDVEMLKFQLDDWKIKKF